MHPSQSISTTGLALVLANRNLVALASVAGGPVGWREEGFNGLSRGRGACPREGGEPWKGLLPWQVKRVRDYVDGTLHGRVSLSVAAGQARLSPNYFSRRFRLAFGVTFSRFVAGQRIERAKRLMVGGTGKLCQIALACGFADQAHFTRTFGNLLGCTPSRWRRQAAANRPPVNPGGDARGRQVFLRNLEFRGAHS